VPAPAETDVVEHEVRVAARPETVFSYFTDPAKMVNWMGVEATLDPRPGGVFRILFEPSRGRLEFLRDTFGASEERPAGPTKPRAMSGKFVDVDPYTRLAFTWGWEQEVFGVAPASTAVEVSLTPDGEGTVLRLAHRRLPAASIEFHRAGWEHYLGRLAVVAGGGDPGPDPWTAGT
jgi:uncharacterized protein YndB with AHSA1/START domain